PSTISAREPTCSICLSAFYLLVE
ncbi:hypothetical protein D030_3528B, partial [Vibrio parahaemolyticus AQ3810]